MDRCFRIWMTWHTGGMSFLGVPNRINTVVQFYLWFVNSTTYCLFRGQIETRVVTERSLTGGPSSPGSPFSPEVPAGPRSPASPCRPEGPPSPRTPLGPSLPGGPAGPEGPGLPWGRDRQKTNKQTKKGSIKYICRQGESVDMHSCDWRCNIKVGMLHHCYDIQYISMPHQLLLFPIKLQLFDGHLQRDQSVGSRMFILHSWCCADPSSANMTRRNGVILDVIQL